MSLPLHLRAENVGLPTGLYKVLGIGEALQQRFPSEQVIVDLRTGPEVALDGIAAFGFAGVITETRRGVSELPSLHSLSLQAALAPGDAARVSVDGKINVLYRRGANANTLFVTERCNNLCLMCSQPPREIDDSWRVSQLIELLPLVDEDLAVLGVTGGEPALLGKDLLALLMAAQNILPTTKLHVLTNGRAFADTAFADSFNALRGHVTWAVPLFAEVAHAHDFVVQAKGAFDETMHGLHNLGERGHRIEVRTVLHAQTLPRIEKVARFIYRNLPFVEHVALMGLEPMGLARSNMSLLKIDHTEISGLLKPAVLFLNQTGMNVSIYNLPLCGLDPMLWPYARQSISDWKNEYADECGTCLRRSDCCGFFRSTSKHWRDNVARPILESAA